MSISPTVREALGNCEGEGERGERGKRGKRGHRGHDGRDGATGPTGPCCTGPTGPANDDTLVAGRFEPNSDSGTVAIVSQTGQFVAATYISVGFYEIVMGPIPGLVNILQTIPVVSAFSIGNNATVVPFGLPGTFRVAITDAAGAATDDTFFIHVKLLLP